MYHHFASTNYSKEMEGTRKHIHQEILFYPLLLFEKKVPPLLQDTPTSDVFSLRP